MSDGVFDGLDLPGAGQVMQRSQSYFVDPGSCLDHLGTLYPLSCSMLYFELESFFHGLVAAVDLEDSSLAELLPEVRIGHLDHHEAAANVAQKLSGFDVFVAFRPISQSCTVSLLPSPTAQDRLRPHVQDTGWGRLRIHIEEDLGISKCLILPIRTLMKGRPAAAGGYRGYVHSIKFKDETGSLIECWNHTGVTDGQWLSEIEDVERHIRSGASPDFLAAWVAYVGDAGVCLESYLVVADQAEVEAAAWVEAEVVRRNTSGFSVNSAATLGRRLGFDVPCSGDTPGSDAQTLDADGALQHERSALLSQTTRDGIPNLLFEAWRGNAFVVPENPCCQSDQSPAAVMTARRFVAPETTA